MPGRQYRATIHSGGTILIPPSTRLPQGVWMHAACSAVGVTANNLVGRVSRVSPRLIPARRTRWSPPLDQAVWDDWLGRQRTLLSLADARFIVQLPRDRRRRRFAILLLDGDGRAIAYAKFTKNPENTIAISALRHLADATQDVPFWFPKLVDHGTIEGWSFTITTTMPQAAHRPARLTAVERLSTIDRIQEILLGAGIGDGTSTFPVHADFGPWNVRSVGGNLAIIDWEETTAGPIAADELWHHLSTDLVGGGSPIDSARSAMLELAHRTHEEIQEAASWWLDRLTRPEPPEIDTEVKMPTSLTGLPARMSRGLLELEQLARGDART